MIRILLFHSFSDNNSNRITWQAFTCKNLSDAFDNVANINVIGIDEGQFVCYFKIRERERITSKFPDIVEFCESMANCGKIVIIAALDGTFERKG